MINCLDKAVEEISLSALVAAESISLMRAERRQRLMLRFACCSPDLALSTGLVGVAKDFGTGHVAITDATVRLIKQLCNDDDTTAEIILRKVEMLCVDAASDEVLSGELLRCRSGADVPVVA